MKPRIVDPPPSMFASSPELWRLIAEKDWAATPVGAPSTWSPALKTVLEVTLASRFPVIFFWGPEFTQFYNDPYRPMLGVKHPASLGQSARECWSEIWDVIGPQLEAVLRGEPATWNEDLLLNVYRYGFVEETYFTFSYSAVPDPSAPGGIGGVLGTVQETTEKVIGERRMHLLRDLAARGTLARTVEDECRLAAATLGDYETLVPFSLLYLVEASNNRARLVATSGIEPGTPDSPWTIDLEDPHPWPLHAAGDSPYLVNDVAARLQRVPNGGWPQPPDRAAIVRIHGSGAGDVSAYLIAGITPRTRFTEATLDFFKLVGSQIATAISSASAYEAERRRAEALAELDRTKNEFFANVSHEFRTPLTLLLGPLEQLSKAADPRERPLLDAAHRNALRLLKLVNTLLEFSRIEAGIADPVYMRTDLAGLTLELCGVFRSAIESAGLSFAVDIALDEPVFVDRAMWEKIVLNLLSNALKFTVRGGISVSLRSEGDLARLVVEDTGCGIPDEELSHVFERFHRVRVAQARTHEGSGIGLALVKELVGFHAGTIAVESVVGRGTRFVVDVPLGIAHLKDVQVREADATARATPTVDQYLAEVDATMVAPPERPSSGRSAGKRARLLVADDNADLRDYVARILEPYYEVTAVADGQSALEALREARFDLILSDVMMPRIDGTELLSAVRADSAISTIPFILLSARVGEESQLEGLALGADDYIAKPFSSEDLLARVEANISAARVREQAWRLSEGRFRVFADRLPLAVWQQDASGNVTFANEQWYAVTGLSKEPWSLTAEAWLTVVHPDDYRTTLQTLERAARERSAYRIEYRIKASSADASAYRWHLAIAEPYFQDGAFEGWIGYIVDVHEARMRETLERALRHSALARERELKALAETIPVIVWTADAQGWIDWYSSRWYAYTGQNPKQAAGWGWQGVVHPDDLPEVMRAWPHSIATGVPFEREIRLRRHDGAYRRFLTRVVPLRDDEGMVARWYGSNVDVEDQQERLDHSRRVSQTLQSLFVPDELPTAEGLHFDAIYVPAERDALVGGDWYDVLPLPDGRILFSVGDVAGHGLDASVTAATLRQSMRDYAMLSENPSEILDNVNRMLRLQSPERYVTAIVGLVNAARTEIAFANAGHPPPLLAKPGAGAEFLSHGGLLLGARERLDAPVQRVAVERDALFCVYTDGLVEFKRDTAAAEAVLAAAAGLLADERTPAHPATALKEAVLGRVSPTDDIAMLVLRFSSPVGVDATDGQPLAKSWRFHSSDAYTAHAARTELMKFMASIAPSQEAFFNVELILGELLANTVRHAPGLVEIEIDWAHAKPVLSVRDEGPGFQSRHPALPADFAEHGRGLFLVRALAHDLSIEHAPGRGTHVRVVLPVERGIPANR